MLQEYHDFIPRGSIQILPKRSSLKNYFQGFLFVVRTFRHLNKIITEHEYLKAHLMSLPKLQSIRGTTKGWQKGAFFTSQEQSSCSGFS